MSHQSEILHSLIFTYKENLPRQFKFKLSTNFEKQNVLEKLFLITQQGKHCFKFLQGFYPVAIDFYKIYWKQLSWCAVLTKGLPWCTGEMQGRRFNPVHPGPCPEHKHVSHGKAHSSFPKFRLFGLISLIMRWLVEVNLSLKAVSNG